MKTVYNNRYDEEYTFTQDKDGNILWEGSFDWCRFSCPNVYERAYEQYLRDGGKMSLSDFEVGVNRLLPDEKGEISEISKKYNHLVYPDVNKISMIDPSGGPYICLDMDLEFIDERFKGKIVKEFQKIKTGYKIITKNSDNKKIFKYLYMVVSSIIMILLVTGIFYSMSDTSFKIKTTYIEFTSKFIYTFISFLSFVVMFGLIVTGVYHILNRLYKKLFN